MSEIRWKSEVKIWTVSQYMPLSKDKRCKRTVWSYLVLAESAEEAVGRVHDDTKDHSMHQNVEIYRATPHDPETVISWGISNWERYEKIPESGRIPVPASKDKEAAAR